MNIIKVTLTLFLLLASLSVYAAAPVVETTTSTFGDASSYTFAATVNTSSNRLLVVSVSVRDSSATIISGVTYDGVSMIEQSQLNQGGISTMGVFTMVDPPQGTANVVVTLGNTDKASIGAITFSGVDSFVNGTHNTGQGSSLSSSITTTQADSLIIALEAHADNVSYTLDGNYTAQWDVITTGNPGGGNVRNAGSTRSAPTVTTYSIASTIGGVDSWHSMQIELKALQTTPTWTPTFTATPTWTPTITQTFTHSPTPTWTPTWSPTMSPTPTWTPTVTQTFTHSPTPTWTPTATPTWTPTFTETFTVSPTPTWTPTISPTFTPDMNTVTVTPTITPTFTPGSESGPSSNSLQMMGVGRGGRRL